MIYVDIEVSDIYKNTGMHFCIMQTEMVCRGCKPTSCQTGQVAKQFLNEIFTVTPINRIMDANFLKS